MIENKELYLLALKLKGEESQVTISIEEMAEAIHALSKFKRLKEGLIERKDAINNIINELSDVQIMVEQLVITFNEEELFNNCKIQKLKRLKLRLEGDKNGRK